MISFPDKREEILTMFSKEENEKKEAPSERQHWKQCRGLIYLGGTKLLIKTFSDYSQLGVPNCNVAASSVIIVTANALSQITRLKQIIEILLKPHRESK